MRYSFLGGSIQALIRTPNEWNDVRERSTYVSDGMLCTVVSSRKVFVKDRHIKDWKNGSWSLFSKCILQKLPESVKRRCSSWRTCYQTKKTKDVRWCYIWALCIPLHRERTRRKLGKLDRYTQCQAGDGVIAALITWASNTSRIRSRPPRIRQARLIRPCDDLTEMVDTSLAGLNPVVLVTTVVVLQTLVEWAVYHKWVTIWKDVVPPEKSRAAAYLELVSGWYSCRHSGRHWGNR